MFAGDEVTPWWLIENRKIAGLTPVLVGEDLPEEDRQALKVLVEGLLMRRQISLLQPTV